jgi:hypothetical protein
MTEEIAKLLIPIRQIPSTAIPGRQHKPIGTRTVEHWCLAGVYGIRLESLKVLGKRYTTMEAWSRFFQAVKDAATVTKRGRPPLVVGPRPRRRQRSRPAGRS